MREMRKPEMTKKTSTPAKPPGTSARSAWKATTPRTASARSPLMSPRYSRSRQTRAAARSGVSSALSNEGPVADDEGKAEGGKCPRANRQAPPCPTARRPHNTDHEQSGGGSKGCAVPRSRRRGAQRRAAAKARIQGRFVARHRDRARAHENGERAL